MEDRSSRRSAPSSPGHGGVTREEADAWAADLRARGEDGRFFFSLNQYLFVAEKG
jgi:hypothetical protein